MKRITSLALALVLTAALFTGCGCSNVSTHPGGMITEESKSPTVMPTPTATHETTRPTETTHATMPTVTGSEPTDSSSAPSDTPSTSTSPTDETNHGRSRHAAPNR